MYRMFREAFRPNPSATGKPGPPWRHRGKHRAGTHDVLHVQSLGIDISVNEVD
jgi:hypothetical protein